MGKIWKLLPFSRSYPSYNHPCRVRGASDSTAIATACTSAVRSMASRSMIPDMLAVKVYISEGRNKVILEEIEEELRKNGKTPWMHVFCDEPYNRTGYTLAGTPASLKAPILSLIRAALSRLDLRHHEASHPRLGVVDHVSVHPLGRATSIESAVTCAYQVACIASEEFALPVFFYGALHPEGRALQTVRRRLGYFRGARAACWQGTVVEEGLQLKPDLGPLDANLRSGLVAVGACPWILNYNIPLRDAPLEVCRRIARRLSTRGGGLPAVEAMALPHAGGSVEIACNLLDADATSPHTVHMRVATLAVEEGLPASAIVDGYLTGPTRDEVLLAAASWSSCSN